MGAPGGVFIGFWRGAKAMSSSLEPLWEAFACFKLVKLKITGLFLTVDIVD